MKKLREMYPNGMYTDNSEAVFERFEELLENDPHDLDEEKESEYNFCGLDGDFDLNLIQYNCPDSYGKNAVHLTNKEFFAIDLGEKPVIDDTPEQLKEGVTQQAPYMPEVGEECESWLVGGSGFRVGQLMYKSKKLIVWQDIDTGDETANRPEHRIFRPIRTEREKLTDALVNIMITNGQHTDPKSIEGYKRIAEAILSDDRLSIVSVSNQK